MKKNICRIIILTLLFVACLIGYNYAANVKIDDKKVCIFSESYDPAGNRMTNERILKKLKEDYNYSGNLTDVIYINTNISIEKETSGIWLWKKETGNYIIHIGNGKENIVSAEELKSVYGWNGETQDSYPVTIMCQVLTVEDGSIQRWDPNDSMQGYPDTYYEIYASEIWSYDDKPEKEDTGDDIEVESNTYTEQWKEDWEETKEWAGESVIGKAFGFVKNFATHPIETVITLFLDVIRTIFGDVPQIIANMIQTTTTGTWKDFKITYSVDKIPDEAKEYIKASNGDVGGDKAEGKIPVDGKIEGFDSSTEIPFIPVDLYNMAVGNIDFLDVNFLNGQTYNDSGAWIVIRNFVAAFIRMVYYIVASILITMLIWHGIHIVKGSLTPTQEKEHRDGINRLAKSILMIVGTILIMAICIFSSKFIFDDLKIGDNKEFPIRVYVKSADYSFSTNIVGYVRYMTQIEEVTQCGEKAGYTVVYIFLAWFNLIAVLFMIIRMFAMMGLAVIGVLIAGIYALNLEEKIKIMTYTQWVDWYISLAMVQVVLAIAVKILFKTAIL